MCGARRAPPPPARTPRAHAHAPRQTCTRPPTRRWRACTPAHPAAALARGTRACTRRGPCPPACAAASGTGARDQNLRTRGCNTAHTVPQRRASRDGTRTRNLYCAVRAPRRPVERVQQHVLRLQVPVHDPVLVQVREPREQLPHEVPHGRHVPWRRRGAPHAILCGDVLPQVARRWSVGAGVSSTHGTHAHECTNLIAPQQCTEMHTQRPTHADRNVNKYRQLDPNTHGHTSTDAHSQTHRHGRRHPCTHNTTQHKEMRGPTLTH